MKKKDETAVAVKGGTTVVGSPAYVKLVKEASSYVRRFLSDALDFYWHLGEKVDELTNKPENYGAHSVEKFAQDLVTIGGVRSELGVSSLYDARSLFKKLSKEQFLLAKDADLSVRRALLLCEKNVTPEVRQEILTEAKNHNGAKDFDIQAALNKHLGKSGTSDKRDKASDTTAGGGVTRAKKIVKSAEHIIQMMEGKLKEVGESIEDICRGDSPEAIKAAHEQWTNANDAFASIAKVWTIQTSKATKAFAKVEDILSKK